VMLTTYLLLPILLDRSWQLADRRLAPLYPIGWMLMVAGAVSLPKKWGLRLAGTLALSAILLLNLSAGLALIASAERPTRALEPWTHFALPKSAPHLRVEVGIGDLAAEEAADFYARYTSLLASSSSGGEEELRGLRRVLAPSSGAIGVLHRPAPACPDEALLERAPPSQITSVGEAQGFGEGLALRCKEDRARAEVSCRTLLRPGLRAACLAPLKEAP